jgi:hypothetical protein
MQPFLFGGFRSLFYDGHEYAFFLFVMRFLTGAVIMLLVVGGLNAFFGWYPFFPDQAEILVPLEETDVLKRDEKGNVLELDPPVVPVEVQEKEQFIDTDWISFRAPARLTETSFVLEADVKKKISSLDVTWVHPTMERRDNYTLKQFRPGDLKASYRVEGKNLNILPGKNTYVMTGKVISDDPEAPEESLTTEFDVFYDLLSVSDINPESITLIDVPSTLQDEDLEIEGLLTVPALSVYVTSYHPDSGKSTFTELQKYNPEKKTFQYFGKESLVNFFKGSNHFMIEAIGEEKKLLARMKFQVQLQKRTLQDEVTEFFGGFDPADAGWYVSRRYPWFSVRPAYEDVFQASEGDLLDLPRPTLLYPQRSSPEVGVCDYLGALDYEAEERVIYKGFSYEKCQSFRYGVSVYDRFLSVLKHTPLRTIKRTEYTALSDMVSSAFLLLETGGMSKEEESFEDKKRFYLYQMMITDQQPFVEGQVGDIELEMTDDQRELFEDVLDFLNRHPGDEMFTPLFFPEQSQ